MRASFRLVSREQYFRFAALSPGCGLHAPQGSAWVLLSLQSFIHLLHLHDHKHVAMNNSLRPKTNTRNTQKCSACRQRKKKVRESGRDLSETVRAGRTDSLRFSQCSPHDRDWENSQQKCDHCETRNLPCGPNLRYSADHAIRRRAAVPGDENSVGGRSATSPAPNVPAPATRLTPGRNDGPPNSNGEDGRPPFGTSSVRDLEEKARSK